MSSDAPSRPRKYRKKKRELPYYLDGIRQGNRFVLAEAITLVESTLPDDQTMAEQVLLALSESSDANSLRIAVTGSPGAGKSTFIDYLGMFWIENGFKVAVLSIDPSSTLSAGSILGDKTRMETLSLQENAFIRPTASGQQLGGISSRTREAILLCEAAGYNRVIVETVGVGQNEDEVSSLTDINLFLLQPGAGDDLQGIKRGVLEKADICIVNKADGHLLEAARETARQYSQSLHYFFHPMSGWHIPVHKVSSVLKEGLPAVIQSLEKFIRQSQESGFFKENRRQQEMTWFEKRAYESMLAWAKQYPPFQSLLNHTKEKIRRGDEDALAGVQEIIGWLSRIKA